MAQSKTDSVSVFLVDDDLCVCEMVGQKLRSFKGISFLGSAENTTKAFTEISRLKPQVLLLDIVLRGDFGANLFKRLKEAMGEKAPPAIGFSCFTFETAIRALLVCGAKGFHAKGDSWTDLVQGIHTVHAGGEFFSESIVRIFSHYFSPVTIEKILASQRLTPTEMNLTELITSGATVKQIAEVKNISEKTINNHRYNIMRKAGVKNIVGLVHYALRSGICGPSTAVLPADFFNGQKVLSKGESDNQRQDYANN